MDVGEAPRAPDEFDDEVDVLHAVLLETRSLRRMFAFWHWLGVGALIFAVFILYNRV